VVDRSAMGGEASPCYPSHPQMNIGALPQSGRPSSMPQGGCGTACSGSPILAGFPQPPGCPPQATRHARGSRCDGHAQANPWQRRARRQGGLADGFHFPGVHRHVFAPPREWTSGPVCTHDDDFRLASTASGCARN